MEDDSDEDDDDDDEDDQPKQKSALKNAPKVEASKKEKKVNATEKLNQNLK